MSFSDTDIFEVYVEETRLPRGRVGVDFRLARWAGYHVINPDAARERAATWYRENKQRAAEAAKRRNPIRLALVNLRYRKSRGSTLRQRPCSSCRQVGHNRRTCRA